MTFVSSASLSRVVIFGVACALCAQIVQICRSTFVDPPERILRSSLSGSVAVPPLESSIDLHGITSANLFGTPTLSRGDIQASQAALVLTGIVAKGNPALGIAIVGTEGASPKIYTVGALVDGAARLKEVYSDRIVLERNGTLESLTFPRSQKSADSTPPVLAAQIAAVAATPGDEPPPIPLVIDNPNGLPPGLRAGSSPGVRIAQTAAGDEPPANPLLVDNPDGLPL